MVCFRAQCAAEALPAFMLDAQTNSMCTCRTCMSSPVVQPSADDAEDYHCMKRIRFRSHDSFPVAELPCSLPVWLEQCLYIESKQL